MNDDLIPLEQVPEVEAAAFNVSEELQKAIDATRNKLEDRSFSGRHPELGKMFKCQVCQKRHRAHIVCTQKFTHSIGDYEYFREDEKGELVPAYRTCIDPETKPTIKQIMGAAQFKGKRRVPHMSRMKMIFVERTRKVFEKLGFVVDAKDKEFDNHLQQARAIAAREIRKESRRASRAVRRQQDKSRRINRGE